MRMHGSPLDSWFSELRWNKEKFIRKNHRSSGPRRYKQMSHVTKQKKKHINKIMQNLVSTFPFLPLKHFSE